MQNLPSMIEIEYHRRHVGYPENPTKSCPQLPEKWYVTAKTDVTNEILGKAGIHLLKMASAQLSRSRGGPRCMSMPFIRAE